ncbi:DNA polymerase-1 [Weissella uvarum]|uniref:DNA polymerase I n=1 Tax=Weissella uvarum TaxID=1479233 RepID=UPI001960EA53|nr:DNA polymerase I [Weissella uvarum]MBM7617507.1 DNA polymerase-1 [Weissella uvarum]MCM0595609.1 DNA polymerase I [Weissella uvarum]
MDRPKLLLIDGNSLAFRAFYAMINQVDRFVNHEGLHTNALVAFNNFLDGIVEPFDPDYAMVAWDAGKTTFRTEKFDTYKGNRDKTPSELTEQFPYLRQMVQLHGIYSYELPNYEADDIIGTTAKKGQAEGLEVTILTGDRDMLQLVDEHIEVWITKKGVSEVEHNDLAMVAEKYDGLSPDQIVDVKGLQGDTSDNYPGVAGIGPKTAIKLIKEYHSIPELYEHIDELKANKQKEKLVAGEADATMSRDLARIRTDAPITFELSDLKYTGPDYEDIIPFYQQLDFKQQLAKLASQGHVAQNSTENGAEAVDAKPQAPLNLIKADDTAEADLPDFTEAVSLYIELDDTDYHTAAPVGFVIGNDDQGYVVGRDIDVLLTGKLKDVLLNSQINKHVFNMKALYVVLHRYGLNLVGVDDDILLMSYLVDTNDNSDDLGALAQQNDYYDVQTDEAVYGKGAKFAIPDDDDVFFEHLGQKGRALNRLPEQLLQQLNEREQTELYETLELPLSQVLAEMEIDGIKVDSQRLLTMRTELDGRLKDLEKTIYSEAGHEFNIQSTKQLGTVLFEEMGYKPIKKTKTGYSTSVEVLEQMQGIPIVDAILQYRQIAKIQSTYVEGLLRVIHGSDSKVHTHYLQTLTQTGRLSSNDPNLQNIPARLEEGRLIRQAFIPSEPDWLIVSSDYSQIELRVLAHISGDENMQMAFKNDEDIHEATARRIFHLSPEDEVDPNMRRKAKAVNFGIVYGISDFGLAKNIGVSRKEAKDIIDTYFEEYPGIKQWSEDIVAFARENGYVETMAHRRRYLPDIHAKNFNVRSFAERTAMNTPIQGSAADIIKIAMLKVQNALKEQGLQSRMLLQVHDELILEVPKTELETIHTLVPQLMDSAMDLAVPLKVSSHEGPTWYDAK